MAVDYNEVSSRTKVLVNNEFHTVISTLTIYDAPTSEAEVNLVRETAQVVTPWRFMASVWGIHLIWSVSLPRLSFQIDDGMLTYLDRRLPEPKSALW
ncbi:uncharacterized protein PG998_014430 [Apiospora kogelbergensis]|uniref:uncharacterized protein n=1 Tax=Apiospora kogelbergensis TaxID=1337665 RepID=UPI00312F3FE7